MFRVMLKKYREAANLSQKKLADILGVSQAAIGMYESGKREPDFSTLCKIADFFKISVDDLIGRDVPADRSPAVNPPSALNPSEIMFALSRGGEEEITDEMFEEVVNFAQYVASRNKGKKE